LFPVLNALHHFWLSMKNIILLWFYRTNKRMFLWTICIVLLWPALPRTSLDHLHLRMVVSIAGRNIAVKGDRRVQGPVSDRRVSARL
jgi:hypothetical protein